MLPLGNHDGWNGRHERHNSQDDRAGNQRIQKGRIDSKLAEQCRNLRIEHPYFSLTVSRALLWLSAVFMAVICRPKASRSAMGRLVA